MLLSECSRSQLLQFHCSCSASGCLGATVPVNGCRNALKNTVTVQVTSSNAVQCLRMSLCCSKMVPPQRFIVVSSNAMTELVHVAQSIPRPIKALRCSQPIQCHLGDVPLKPSFPQLMQLAKRDLAIFAATP